MQFSRHHKFLWYFPLSLTIPFPDFPDQWSPWWTEAFQIQAYNDSCIISPSTWKTPLRYCNFNFTFTNDKAPQWLPRQLCKQVVPPPYLDVPGHLNVIRPISDEESSTLVIDRCWFRSPHRHCATSLQLYTVNCLERQSSAVGPYTQKHTVCKSSRRFTILLPFSSLSSWIQSKLYHFGPLWFTSPTSTFTNHWEANVKPSLAVFLKSYSFTSLWCETQYQ